MNLSPTSWFRDIEHPVCPDCGLRTDCTYPHVCNVPLLTEAAGLTLTADEQRAIRWLAGWERETCEVLAGLLRRIREKP